jgi:hypothetical protein
MVGPTRQARYFKRFELIVINQNNFKMRWYGNIGKFLARNVDMPKILELRKERQGRLANSCFTKNQICDTGKQTDEIK